MESILDLYEEPYDAKKPVVCFDERACQLLGNTTPGIPMRPGQAAAAKEDYHYTHHGTCCILMAFEPLTGRRFVQVRARRTARDYAEFLEALVEEQYPEATVIRLVQDNLNTHKPASFYKRYPAAEGFSLGKAFEWHYTPKNACWLNMIELEFSVLSRQCLSRRIPTQEELSQAVESWTKSRNDQRKTVNWQFTKKKARKTFKRKYEEVRKN